MADYWIEDESGRVLGPVGVGILRDLISAGRLERITRASRDGHQFSPLIQLPEVQDVVATQLRLKDEKAEAKRLRDAMEELRARPLHEVFGVERNAPLEMFRSAFFQLVKQYHPERLSDGAHADLRQVHDEIFHFLGSKMAEAERASGGSSPSGPAAPTWAPGEFVGLVHRPGRPVEMNVRVTAANAAMFTRHPLVNLSRDGVFLPLLQEAEIGTILDMVFHVEPTSRRIQARGKVVWNDVGSKQRPAGVGVKFIRLEDGDRTFLAEFVRASGT